MAMTSLSEVYLPTVGGTVEGDVEVNGSIVVNDGSGEGTTYDVASEITELKSAWDSVSQNKILWSDVNGMYMDSDQTIELSDTVSNQTAGIVMVFSAYNPTTNTTYDDYWSTYFIPKFMVSDIGLDYATMEVLVPWGNNIFYKRIFVYDTKLVGYSDNESTAFTLQGKSVDNRCMVLKYVVGV